jgi:hypothetical protein
VVARLTGALPGATVADVGGRGHEMQALLPGCRVTSVNIEQPCDLLVAPGPLPLREDAVDLVTSTDVLEHLRAAERAAHLAELVRVARHRVVVCFPCGSDAKDASEQRLARRLSEEHGVRFDFLDEHLERGLPRISDVLAAVHDAAPDAEVRVAYEDGVERAERLLLDAVRALEGRQPGAVLRSARSWLVRRWPELTTQQSEDNNRAYVVIDLGAAAPGRAPR